jgi:hypothetical protein
MCNLVENDPDRRDDESTISTKKQIPIGSEAARTVSS